MQRFYNSFALLGMKLHLLLSRGFITGLLVLIINDHLLKGYYGNWITGKLSDFAGLFIFPMFFTALFPKAIRFHHLFTFVFFIFWKTGLSEGFIQWINSIGFPAGRVVDYTDFMALFSVPASYYYCMKIYPEETLFVRGRFAAILAGCIAMVSFTATSTIKRFHPSDFVYIDKTYKSRLSKKAFIDSVESIGLQVRMDNEYLQKHADTLYIAEDNTPLDSMRLNELQVKGVHFILSSRAKGCYVRVLQLQLKQPVKEEDMNNYNKLRRKAKRLSKKFLIDPLD